MAGAFTKDPDAVLDYQFNWSAWLAGGETITAAAWTVPTGLTKGEDSKTDTTATVWLSGGTIDADYIVSCKVTTSAGRTDERGITILCRNR